MERCFAGLQGQTAKVDQIIVVDSGSADTAYLDRYGELESCSVIKTDNIGFGAANNLGIQALGGAVDFLLLVNPDTILAADCVGQCISAMHERPDSAALTGALRGYDIKSGRPTDRYDSTGIFRAWYGRWYDRDHGAPVEEVSRDNGSVPAICGALMFLRFTAIETDLPQVFDESFFLYKEDIELSLRLRQRGWDLSFVKDVHAYHGRGWSARRHDMDRATRLLAASNEVRLYRRHPSVYMLWALLKLTLVKLANV
jgi:GT2 family glycosyltransferase